MHVRPKHPKQTPSLFCSAGVVDRHYYSYSSPALHTAHCKTTTADYDDVLAAQVTLGLMLMLVQ